MIITEILLLGFLVTAAVAVCVSKHLLASVIVFAAYSLAMTVVWLFLRAPDLAITEAAVSTGISSILFFVVLKRIRVIEKEHEEHHEQAEQKNADK